jgi:hypothetical protein
MQEDPREVVKRNTPEAFDYFWGSSYAVDNYMTVNRRRHCVNRNSPETSNLRAVCCCTL